MLDALLLNCELSEVTFIHDYIQLTFYEVGLSAYNHVTLEKNGVRLRQGDSGFCDLLVTQIGSAVTAVNFMERESLSVTFNSGVIFSIGLAEIDQRGAEAFQVNNLEGLILVEQNE